MLTYELRDTRCEVQSQAPAARYDNVIERTGNFALQSSCFVPLFQLFYGKGGFYRDIGRVGGAERLRFLLG